MKWSGQSFPRKPLPNGPPDKEAPKWKAGARSSDMYRGMDNEGALVSRLQLALETTMQWLCTKSGVGRQSVFPWEAGEVQPWQLAIVGPKNQT